MKKACLMLVLLACSLIGNAQNWQKTNFGVKTDVMNNQIEIQFFSPSIVRIQKWPQGKVFTKESLSVVKTPQSTKLKITQKANTLSLRSESIEVLLNMQNGQITFKNTKGETLLAEKENGAAFTEFNDTGVKTFSVHQTFKLDNHEAIYGLGIQQQGKMSQRNTNLRMVQGNTDDYVTFFQSVKGYGLFWDNYSPTNFTDSPNETVFFSEVGDGIDYYFMFGGNADGVVAQMRVLTGQTPMFPLWTFGYWQSKERYKSQNETVGVVKKYRSLGVPLDGIIQDWQYWGNNYLWNAMEFLNPEFGDPQKMVNDIHNLNARIIISFWSSFGPMTKQYREFDQKGMLMNFRTWPLSGSEKWPPNPDYPSGVRVYDAYHPEARDIYWRYLNDGLFSLGIDGWWMDSTEPDHLESKPEDFDNQTYLGSFRKVRNAYPLMSVGGVYKNQRSVTSDKRVFILTRSAFAGQQRYGANTWSGDVGSSWDEYKRQIVAGLNFTITGLPYWTTDIGGFFRPGRTQYTNPDYHEILTRWYQWGTFNPIFRMHGYMSETEPWKYGQQVEDNMRKMLNLRYQLLPYIYSEAWQVTSNGSTIMRPLVMDFANDNIAVNKPYQFMFGKAFLVAPVTEAGITQRDVYLPKQSGWFDFWTGNYFEGGQTIQAEAPLDKIPLFIKSGSIVPMGKAVQHSNQNSNKELDIYIFEGNNGELTLYEDEGNNYNYENGAFSTIKFSWNNAKQELIIGKCNGSYPGMANSRVFNLYLVKKDKPADQGLPVVHYSVIHNNGKGETVLFN